MTLSVIYSRRMALRPRRARRALASAGALVLTLAALAGCGGQEQTQTIPASSARNLLAQLDEVGRRVNARACSDVRNDSLPALQQHVDSLPDRVDDQVRATLDDGVAHLEELVSSQCRPRPRPKRTREKPIVIPTPKPQAPTYTPRPRRTPSPQPQTPSTQQPGTRTGNGGNTGTGGGTGSGSGSGGSGSGTSGGGTTGGGSSGGGSGALPPGQGPGASPGDVGNAGAPPGGAAA